MDHKASLLGSPCIPLVASVLKTIGCRFEILWSSTGAATLSWHHIDALLLALPLTHLSPVHDIGADQVILLFLDDLALLFIVYHASWSLLLLLNNSLASSECILVSNWEFEQVLMAPLSFPSKQSCWFIATLCIFENDLESRDHVAHSLRAGVAIDLVHIGLPLLAVFVPSLHGLAPISVDLDIVRKLLDLLLDVLQ